MNSVSCIIPVYGLDKPNALEYFQILLDSINNAILKIRSSFELIIVNDQKSAITKATIDHCIALSGLSDVYVYLENEENKGQAYSRNKGVRMSKYEYLHFIDQDDYISNNFYDIFASNINEDVCVMTPMFYMQETSTIVPAYTRVLNYFYSKAKHLSFLWPLLLVNIAYSPGQVFIKRSCFSAFGGFPILENRGSDDYGLFYRFVFRGRLSFRYVNNAQFFYRTHYQQSSRNCNMSLSVLEFLKGETPSSLREYFIYKLKTTSYFSLFIKLFYVIVFKRAK